MLKRTEFVIKMNIAQTKHDKLQGFNGNDCKEGKQVPNRPPFLSQNKYR